MIRQAQLKDLNTIMDLYNTGRAFMRKCGNNNQWINGYPSVELVTDDIKKNKLFVAFDEKCIYGVFAYIEGEDPTYKMIYEGSWKNNNPYGTIHRIAGNGIHKGLLKEVTQWAWNKINNLKADTHSDNKVMQNALKKNGFEYCGIITIEDGSQRLAYQKC